MSTHVLHQCCRPAADPSPSPGLRRIVLLVAVLTAWIELADAATGGDPLPAILESTGVRGGLVVHLGFEDEERTAALRADERFLVHAFSAHAERVERARAHAPPGVFFYHLSSNRLPYADNMVNLLVANDPSLVDREEMLRVLRPGGVALTTTDDGRPATDQLVKPWPEDIDEWTHWLHGPDGNAVARDRVAGPPRRMQWIAGPLWSRHHNTVPSVTGQVSAAGRVFYIVDEAPASMDNRGPDRWALIARDAFNGLPLWRRPIEDWGWKAWSADWTCRFTVPTHIPKRLVASGDRVYVTLGFNAPLTELDAATGETLRVFDGTEYTDEILLWRGRLILAVNEGPQGPGGRDGPPPVAKSVAAIDVASGRTEWKTGPLTGLRSKTGSMDRISHLSMVVGGGCVYLLDGEELVALSLQDGKQRWRTPRPEIPEAKMRYNIRISDMCSLVYGDGRLLFAQLNPDRTIDWREIRGRVHCFDAETGAELWSRGCASWGWGHPADVFLLDDLVWVGDYEEANRSDTRVGTAAELAAKGQWGKAFRSAFYVGLDPETGAVQREVSVFDAFNEGHHHRCYRNKATERWLMTSYRGLEFTAWDGSGTPALHHWVRGTCRLGPFPCNGLVYANPHPCQCYLSSKLNGFVALAPEAEKASAEADDAPRLQRGPAYEATAGREGGLSDAESDWPTFRHDPERSGSTPHAVGAQLVKIWEKSFGGSVTASVIADGTIYVGNPEAHRIHAVDLRDGDERWRFTAGGRVDTPPTVHQGRLLFGCADGCVYALRAQDGRLAWRLRAAPRERWITAFGDVESAWPVHGSVLVVDNVVYFTAGRSSLLDGGIFACAADAATGKVLSQRRLKTPYDLDVNTGHRWDYDSGHLSDVLVGHAGAVYMRYAKLFDAGAGARSTLAGPLHSTAGLRDGSWFSRVGWHLGDRRYGEYLVFDAQGVYGLRARKAQSTNGGFFTPGAKGYELFRTGLKAGAAGGDRPPGDRAAPPKSRWSIRVPVRVCSMVLAGDTLFAAGTPDFLDPADPWAAYEGKRGGKLLALSAADGEILASYELEAPPVLDGMAASRGRLLVSTSDGRIVCYAETGR